MSQTTNLDNQYTTCNIMNVTIGEVPHNVIRIAFPPSDKKIAIRPLWNDGIKTKTTDEKTHNKVPKFATKMDNLFSNLNDKIITYVADTEKYDSADSSFRSSLENELNNIKHKFMLQLSRQT